MGCNKSKAVKEKDNAQPLAASSSPAAAPMVDIEDVHRATCCGLGPKPCELKVGGGPDFLKGKYAWCTCGLSKNQPFCDGSHAQDARGKGFQPLVFEVNEAKTAYLCTCKATKNPPYCDGSHAALSEANLGKMLPKMENSKEQKIALLDDTQELPRPTCGGLQPKPCDLKPGGGPEFLKGKYAWCTCGLSKSQPFCDGSHSNDPRGKGFQPLVFEVQEPKTAYLCTCKATKTPPYCDGSHTSLSTDSVGQRLASLGHIDPKDTQASLRPICGGLKPKPCDLKPGGGPEFLKGKYAWCTCGLSKNQPFCDGSHAKDPRGKGFQPLVFEVDEPKKAYLCTCKATKTPPYCDGSHGTLKEECLGKLLPSSDMFLFWKVLATSQLSHDTKRLSLQCEDEQVLEAPVSSHYSMRFKGTNGSMQFRPYTPILIDSSKRVIDFVIKRYEKGLVSPMVHSLMPGDLVELRGPIQGAYSLAQNEGKHTELVFFAAGTGITPILQIANASTGSQCKMCVFLSNHSEADVLCKAELAELATKAVPIFHILKEKGSSSSGSTSEGRISSEILLKHLARPGTGSHAVVCGPPGYVEAVKDLLQAHGYSANQITIM